MQWNTKNIENNIYPLNRRLSDYEIRKRIGFDDFPGHNTKWRYFEKDNLFVEFGNYQFKTYTRSGPREKFDSIPFKRTDLDVSEKLMEIDGIINEGYYEKQRPSLLPKVSPDIIDWKFTSEITESHIENSEVDKLEYSLKINIPYVYRVFVTSILHNKFLNSYQDFQISKAKWGRIEAYFLPREIIELSLIHI